MSGLKSQFVESISDDKIYVTANNVNKTMRQAIIDGDIGKSGSSNTSTLLLQDAESATVAGFTQTGLVIATDPDTLIRGKKVFQLIHQPSSNVGFKETIVATPKFRGSTMAIGLDIRSTASNDNVSVQVKDETNNVVLTNGYESLQTTSTISAANCVVTSGSNVISTSSTVLTTLAVGMSVTGTGIATGSVIKSINIGTSQFTVSKNATASFTGTLRFSVQFCSRRSVQFVLPANCDSLSYEIRGSQEAGSPETYIDDISIDLVSVASGFDVKFKKYQSTEWTNAGPIPLSAVVTAPTKGTIINDGMWWRRLGDSMEIRYEFQHSLPGITPAYNGNGAYLFGIPNSQTIDSAKVGSLTFNTNVGKFNGRLSDASSFIDYYDGYFFPYNTTKLAVYFSYSREGGGNANGAGILGHTLGALGYPDVIYNGSVIVPIAGWNDYEDDTVQVGPVAIAKIPDATLEMSGLVSLASSSLVLNMASVDNIEGDAIKLVRNSVAGDFYEVTRDGIYDVLFTSDISTNTSGGGIVITKNGDNYTNTNYASIPGLYKVSTAYESGGNAIITCSGSALLKVGDKVRVQKVDTTATPQGNAGWGLFKMTYRGGYEAVNVSKNNKIKLPTSWIKTNGMSAPLAGTYLKGWSGIDGQIGSGFTTPDVKTLRCEKYGLAIVTYSDASTAAAGMAILKNLPQAYWSSNIDSIPRQYICGTTITDNANWTDALTITEIVKPGDYFSFTTNGQVPMSGNLNYSGVSATLIELDVEIGLNNIQPNWSQTDMYYQWNNWTYAFGSSNTRIFYLTAGSVVANVNTSDNISISGTAATGTEFKILQDGTYSFSISMDAAGAAGGGWGLSVNSNQLTTTWESINASDKRGMSSWYDTAEVAWQGFLKAGDIVRMHNSSMAAQGGSVNYSTLSISKIGKPNITALDVSAFVASENKDYQVIEINNTGSFTNAVVAGTPTKNTNTGILSYSAGTFTALKRCKIDMVAALRALNTGYTQVEIFKSTGHKTSDLVQGITAGWCSANMSDVLEAGESFYVNNAGTSDTQRVTVVAEAVVSTITAANSDLIGEIIWSPRSTAPFGFISAANKSVGKLSSTADFKGDQYRALFDLLWNMAGLSTTAGDPFRISAAKGVSAQADWDANKTITIDFATNEVFVRQGGAGRNVGSYQADAFQGHGHNLTFDIGTVTNGSNSPGANYTQFVWGNGSPNGTHRPDLSSAMPNGYGTPRVATETRPKNVALNAYIRYTAENQIIESSRPRINRITPQSDTATYNAGTSWIQGPVFPVITNCAANSKLKVFWHAPCRNDSSSWGGMYIEVHMSINGGAWATVGHCGYDGGVMNNGSPSIGTFNNTIYIDPLQASAYSVQFRWYLKSYDGTASLNGSHDIFGNNSGVPFYGQSSVVNQSFAHMIIEEYVNL